MRKILLSIFIIIGTIVGAGFASGQEIASFFNRYGNSGLYGLLLSCVMFGMIIFYALPVIDSKNNEWYDKLMGKYQLIKGVEEIFLIVSFCIMIAGIGAFFSQQLRLPFWSGSLIGSIICFCVFSFQFKGLEIFNTVLTPVIILGIIMIGLGKYDVNALDKIQYTFQGGYADHFLLSSFLYVGYNSLILIPILTSLKRYALDNKQKCIVAIGCFAILTLIGTMIFRVIDMFYPKIMVYELPTLQLAGMLGTWTRWIYSFIILFAIFTTAISSGYAFLKMNSNYYEIKNGLLCAIGFVLSNVGFSRLVNILFPVFGYMGILEIVMIFIIRRKD